MGRAVPDQELLARSKRLEVEVKPGIALSLLRRGPRGPAVCALGDRVSIAENGWRV